MASKKIADDLKKLMSKVRVSLQSRSNAKKARDIKEPSRKRFAKNPTDPNLLARSVIEAAIGEPLTPKAKPKTSKMTRLKK